MTDNDKDVEKLAAMVDFFSDRAEAHASFFLASIFGLFAVLAIAQYDLNENTSIILLGQEIARGNLWAFAYWLLFLAGLYSFLNFSLYANYAQKVTEHGIYGQPSMHDKIDSVLVDARRRSRFLRWVQKSKDFTRRWNLRVVICIFYSGITFISCVLVIEPAETIWGIVFAFTAIAIASGILKVFALAYDYARKNGRE